MHCSNDVTSGRARLWDAYVPPLLFVQPHSGDKKSDVQQTVGGKRLGGTDGYPGYVCLYSEGEKAAVGGGVEKCGGGAKWGDLGCICITVQ